MKVFGMIAIIIAWIFVSLSIWGIFYQSGFRDLVTIMVVGTGWVLVSMCFVFIAIITLKR